MITSYDLIELRHVMRCGGILKTTEAVCGVDVDSGGGVRRQNRKLD